jgi:glycosyltransferase involved in cell wall biosynthesis
VFVHPAEDLLGCPAERSHCISNGVPEVEPYAREEARRLLEIPQEEKCIAAPCRLAAQKNLPTLLRALALLPNDVTLRIYGSGALRDRLLRLARTLGIEGRVRFHAETDDLPRKMRAFDVVALPSLYEGCSYVLLETLAAGVPLVASDIPANHLTAETDKTVRYFPPLDARLLAAQLTDALAAPATRPLRPFTLEAQADALAGMYESLVR